MNAYHCDIVGASSAASAFDKSARNRSIPVRTSTATRRSRACRDKLGIVYHPMSVSGMGNDEMVMVDAQLRVRGMQGLRVIDASIMPALTGGAANSPTIKDPERRRT
jgi:choline dehydrogenase-like flavoprotein